jgi:hypothetical protein
MTFLTASLIGFPLSADIIAWMKVTEKQSCFKKHHAEDHAIDNLQGCPYCGPDQGIWRMIGGDLRRGRGAWT